tara:strand:- start:217 stop:543 length:327 start_codon:yes stop_codon:yes gene_type:complete
MLSILKIYSDTITKLELDEEITFHVSIHETQRKDLGYPPRSYADEHSLLNNLRSAITNALTKINDKNKAKKKPIITITCKQKDKNKSGLIVKRVQDKPRKQYKKRTEH